MFGVCVTLCLLLFLHGGDSQAKQTFKEQAIDLDLVELHRSLRFEPPEIDFGSWSVGVARSHKVTLVNENANRSVYLSSVSGRTPVFYSSFFESRVVPPNSNTTFDVVFLPRKSAIASDYLLVHTSFGQARLMVRGEGFECPYKLKPIVGIRAPLNALLTPEILMYNPHNHPLQILEVYSSGGQFQLELPSGLASAPQALWEIPPHVTKPIIRIKFHANSAGNHTSYIRIKIATQPPDDDDAATSHMSHEDVLVVPVEFEILPNHGMYAANPVLDFGRLTNTKAKKPNQLKLQLQHSDERHTAQKISVTSVDESLITGLSYDESEASFTLDTQRFNSTTTLDEVLTMQSSSGDNMKDAQNFTVRLRAEIFKGNLHYNRNASVFITGTNRYIPGEQRTFSIRNDFEQPLAVLNISMPQNKLPALEMKFTKDYDAGLILQPGQTFDLLQLQLKDEKDQPQLQYSSQMLITTNVTNFDVPIIVCKGHLKVTTYIDPVLKANSTYSTELNMGTVPLAEMSQHGYVALHNLNPIIVKMTNWNFKSPQNVYFHTTAMGCLRPAALEALRTNQNVDIESANFRFCSFLNEGDVAVFQVAIQSYVMDQQTATLQIWTPYETITTTVLFHTWMGKLEMEQEQLLFKNCFPGKLCTADFSIRSTFQHPIHITAINFSDVSLRFEHGVHKKNLIYALTPNAVTRLGRIYFEPHLHCQQRCYLPLDEKLNSLAFPTTTSPLSDQKESNNNFHFDEVELRKRIELFRQIKWYFRAISVTVYSRELRQLQLQAFVNIEWPKLVMGKQTLPTIEAGKSQDYSVTIKNPLNRPLLVDYFLSDPKYARETKLSLPLEIVDIAQSCYLTDKPFFSIPIQPKKPLIVPPLGSTNVVVRFQTAAKEVDSYCSLLHIRNNLTLYEAVWISAKSVQSQFRFGNRKPGSTMPLMYDVNEKHLTACQQKLPVVVKRSFTARNTGEVPIWIETFMIDDQKCEGYGFKVLGCGKGFELKANDSRKIEIAFRPDFTASRIVRPLKILTNLSYDIVYDLKAQLPPSTNLNECTELQVRPSWENHIRLVAVVLLMTSFFLVLAAAHIDAESIGRAQSALYIAREKGPVHPTFNLRNIAVKATLGGKPSVVISSGNTNANANGTESPCTGKLQQKNSNHLLQQSTKLNNNQCKKRSVASPPGGKNEMKKCPTAKTNNIWPLNFNYGKMNNEESSENDLYKNFRQCIANYAQQREESNESSTNNKTNSAKASSVVGATTGTGTGTTTPTTTKSHSADSSPNEQRDLSSTKERKQKSPTNQQQQQQQQTTKPRTSNRKSRNSTQNLPPPPSKNPILDLMDKEETVKSDNEVNPDKYQTKSLKASEKNTSPDLKSSSSSSSSSSSTIVGNNVNFEKISSPPLAPAEPRSQSSSGKSSTGHGKYGKTPGRERRKEKNEQNNNNNNSLCNGIVGTATSNSNPINPTSVSVSAASSSSSLNSSSAGSYASKRSERKDRRAAAIKAVQALNFNEPPSTSNKNRQPAFFSEIPINCISSPWEMTGNQQMTFSDIILNKNDASKEVYNKKSKLMNSAMNSNSSYFEQLGKENNHQSYFATEPLPESIAMNMSANSFGNANNNNNSELGPIGTKKSPSSTPVWESARTLLQPQPQPKDKPSDGDSFFSNLLTNVAAADSSGGSVNFEYCNPQNLMNTGLLSDSLFDLKNAEEIKRIKAREYLFELYQQQEQQKQQQLEEQKLKEQIELLQNRRAAMQWLSSNAPTASNWTPMGYNALNPYNNENETNPTTTTTAAAAVVSTSNLIQNNLSGLTQWPGATTSAAGSATIRPPPGLETSTAATTSSGVSFVNGFGHGPNHQSVHQRQQHQPAMPSNPNEEVRAFDPFSSLSSIWSESWNKPNNSNNSSRQNGHQH